MQIEKFEKEEYWSIHLKVNEHDSLLFNLNKIDSKKFDLIALEPKRIAYLKAL